MLGATVLKNADRAIIDPEKFTGYCLNPDHEDGRHKARIFAAKLGFDRSNYTELIASIRRAIVVTTAESLGDTAHGSLWRVDIPIVGPRGAAVVRTGWLYEKGKDVPHLTTAYVRRGR